MPSETSVASPVEVRPARIADLEAVVRVHESAFPGFFLTRMGRPFLRELYRGFSSDPAALALVAVCDGKVVGFVTGSCQPEDFFRRQLTRRWPAYLLAAVPAILRHPLFVGRRLASGLFYRGDQSRVPGAALLSSIAVDPQWSGRSAGKALAEAFCDQARTAGADKVYLVTDSEDNAPVNRFYARCGFALESSFTKQNGRKMNRYLKQVSL